MAVKENYLDAVHPQKSNFALEAQDNVVLQLALITREEKGYTK